MRAERLAMALGIALFGAACQEQKTEVKAPRPVRSVVTHAQDIGKPITQTGEIRPRHETPLAFRMGGELRSRLDVGRSVLAGDTVATIDATPARNDVLSATAEVGVAEASLGLMEQTAQRVQELHTRAVASRAQLQDAEANLKTARARLDLARANLAKADETLTYTQLRAPHDGVVASTAANVGQTMAAGQTTLTLVSADRREAVFDVPESLISAADIGDPAVEVSLISDPSVKAVGKVREVAPASDTSTRTFRVKVALGRGADGMPLGAAVIGRLVLPRQRLYALPASALTRDAEAPSVFVYDAGAKRLRARRVTVERYDDERVIVSQGLSDGEVVVVAGISKLRDGEIVELEKATAQ